MSTPRKKFMPILYLAKRFMNPRLRHLANSQRGSFAIVYHVGRKSGKPYETPVIARPAAGGFMLALTYGPEVDWYRNVMAAGKCRLRWHGTDYEIHQIVPLGKEDAIDRFSRLEQFILRLRGTSHFLRMDYLPMPPKDA